MLCSKSTPIESIIFYGHRRHIDTCHNVNIGSSELGTMWDSLAADAAVDFECHFRSASVKGKRFVSLVSAKSLFSMFDSFLTAMSLFQVWRARTHLTVHNITRSAVGPRWNTREDRSPRTWSSAKSRRTPLLG